MYHRRSRFIKSLPYVSLLEQTFDWSVRRKNGREIKRQQIWKHIHHCLLKFDPLLDAARRGYIADDRSILCRFYQNSEIKRYTERCTAKRPSSTNYGIALRGRQISGVTIFVTICCRLTPIHHGSVSACGSFVFITERRHWSTFALCRVVIGQLTWMKLTLNSACYANYVTGDVTNASAFCGRL